MQKDLQSDKSHQKWYRGCERLIKEETKTSRSVGRASKPIIIRERQKQKEGPCHADQADKNGKVYPWEDRKTKMQLVQQLVQRQACRMWLISLKIHS